MTPQEKAKDLINKFRDDNYFQEQDSISNAKTYALIAVDEIIRSLYASNPYDEWTDGMEWTSDDQWYLEEYKKYWNEVINELNKF